MLVDSESMRVKIIDFGSSMLLSPGEQQKSVAGTPEFMAPEVVSYEAISSQTGRNTDENTSQHSVFTVLYKKFFSAQINGLWE